MNKYLLMLSVLLMVMLVGVHAQAGVSSSPGSSGFLDRVCEKCSYCKTDPNCDGCAKCADCASRSQVSTKIIFSKLNVIFAGWLQIL